MNNDEQALKSHADQDVAVFSVIVAIIMQLDAKRVTKHGFRLIKGNAMLPCIGVRLLVIPLKLIINHNIRAARSSVKG